MKDSSLTVNLAGAICGSLWWPVGSLAGHFTNINARGPWGFWQKGDTFRDALLSVLCKHGGDFSGALFAADTVLRVELTVPTPTGYRKRIREIPVVSLPDCADLVRPETFSSDFI